MRTGILRSPLHLFHGLSRFTSLRRLGGLGRFGGLIGLAARARDKSLALTERVHLSRFVTPRLGALIGFALGRFIILARLA